jgi:GT2 family glycosyltransferase
VQNWIILLNWNGWKDTIECLESVFRLNCASVGVMVCDNGSTDGSLEQIKAWARGEIRAQSGNPQLAHLISPPVPKPIACREITRNEAESSAPHRDARLIMVQNGGNIGFPAGNNVGLRHALRDPEARYFWMLNNDTVVDPAALSAMIRPMEQDPKIGLCGCLNLDYANPELVQAQGGLGYNLWMGRSRAQAVRTVNELTPRPPRIDYVNGASMVASRAFLEQVGLMEESYIHYFEETDWAMRARGRFTLGYARESVIYHKLGMALGSSADRAKRSLRSEGLAARSRILFTRRFVPYALPSVVLFTCLSAVHRLTRGDIERFKTILRWMWKGLTDPIPKTTAMEQPLADRS